jgi:hypothetical protein
MPIETGHYLYLTVPDFGHGDGQVLSPNPLKVAVPALVKTCTSPPSSLQMRW